MQAVIRINSLPYGAEFRQSYFVAELLEDHLHRHPALDLMGPYPDQIGGHLRALFELDDHNRVRNLRGKPGMVDLMHDVEAVDLAAAADRYPGRMGRKAVRT